MIAMVLALALVGSPTVGMPAAANKPPAAKPASVRVEKLTPGEMKSLTEARKAVAQAEAKLGQAKRILQGTEQGIEEAHHANTDCGCYLNTEGMDFDKVQFKGDTIIIRHVHQAPPSLSPHAGGSSSSSGSKSQ